jgi:hypothetical protein
MPDNRTVAHEVQEQLVAAVQRGHKQLLKRQEQLKKGREVVNDAIRSGNEFAKSVRPNIPALQTKGLHLPQLSTLPSPAKLRAHAQEFAGQVAATQRNLADKALQVAAPIVVDGVAKLNQVAKSLREEREHPEPLAPRAVKDASEPASPATPDAEAEKPAAAKAGPSKSNGAKTSTAKTSTAKTGAAQTSAARTSAAKTSTARTSTAKAASSSKTSRSQTSAAKPRTAKAKD